MLPQQCLHCQGPNGKAPRPIVLWPCKAVPVITHSEATRQSRRATGPDVSHAEPSSAARNDPKSHGNKKGL